MTKEDFDKGFKHLKRFLKEEGCYTKVMNLLFYEKRRPNDLFKEFNNETFSEDFKWNVLFVRINLIGQAMYHSSKYQEFIEIIFEKKKNSLWKKYCLDNDINY